MTDEYRTVGVHMPEDWIEHADELADEYDTTRAAVFRELIDVGFIAQRESEIRFNPKAQTRRDAIEMIQDGDHPRWSDASPDW